ncbi:gamma-mobile-trio protein GmtX [Hydrogenophaga sp.]|uniref:gamma-mobile-trio protein GmtX n=1 Tax=Hydrogenophaga sp. TaxID=1904254 RepID=UPI002FCB7FDB
MAADPKQLLGELCAQASPRKVRSLELIFALCEEQHERGSKDFSVATIGRLSADRGGPSAAAIRNKTGEPYRALMKTYADSVGGRSRKVAAGPLRDEVDVVLEGITDPVVRTRVNLLLAELRSLRAQLLCVRHLANQNAAIVIGGTTPTATTSGREGLEAGGLRLTALEQRALQAAISERTLAHWGWTMDKSGRITSESGQVVFGAGFASAVKKALELSSRLPADPS